MTPLTQPERPQQRPPRGSRRPRTDRLTTVWMIAALVAAALAVAGRNSLPQTWWTTIHLVTLGVLTNGIMQWSWFFARAQLHLSPHDKRAGRDATVRSLTFNAALLGIFAGMWASLPWLVIASATAVGAIIAWHGFAFTQAMRRALGSRTSVVLRFYVAASALFVLGCAVAGLITVALLNTNAPAWLIESQDRWSLAHAILMVTGWLGLSIAGTLVTLGPTMLRTRMDPVAVHWALRALPLLVAAVIVSATAAVLGAWVIAGFALAVYGAGLGVWIGVPLARAALGRTPHEHAAWSMTAGVAWAGFGIAAVSVGIARAADAITAREAVVTWLAVVGAGGLAQIFLGALSYLMPVVIGGGPASARAGIGTIEILSPARLAARNAALVGLAVTTGTGSPIRWVWWTITLATFAFDIVLLAVAGVRQVRVRRAVQQGANDALPAPPVELP